MDTKASFKSMLTTANYSAKAKDSILEFCCESLSELANLPSKDLDHAINNLHKALSNSPVVANQVRLNATKCMTLHAIRLHFLDRTNCGSKLDRPQIAALTPNDVKKFRIDYLETTLNDTDTKGLSTVSMPKLVSSKWTDFRTNITESLSRIIGKNKIPLTYLVRDDDKGDFEATYENRVDKLVACIELKGAAYKHDNSDLFSLLIQHTEGSEGYAIVETNEKKRNGRKAWTDLLNHFEGSTFKERMAQDAANMLRHATYSGPRKNFTFGDYYSRHSKAHIKLQKAGKPMSTEQQVDSFIQGIQCAVAQNIIVNLAGDPTIRKTFDTYYNAVASKLELSISLSNKPTNSVQRNVNQTNSERDSGRNSSGTKRNQGSYNKNSKKPRSGRPFTPEARRYSPQEWRALTSDQQNRIKALHKANRTSQGSSAGTTAHSQSPYSTAVSTYNRPGLPVQQNRYANQCQSIPQYQNQQYYNHPNSISPNTRFVSQVTVPPVPPSIVPPPPPPRYQNDNQTTDHISAMTGEAGQSWGIFPGPQ